MVPLSDDVSILLVYPQHVVPSKYCSCPTATNNPLEVSVLSVVLSVVVLSVLVVLDELLDEVQDMEMKLKRNMEKMMSICLTCFPISGLGEPNI